MDDEPESYEKPARSRSPASMSKVPSWISLGVVIGVLIGFALQPKPQPPQTKYVEVTKTVPRPNSIPTVEAIFEAWRDRAVWRDDDTTQIAVWNPDTNDFTDFYEVKRVGDLLYFRTIPRLTRELMNYAASELPAKAPILFAGATERTSGKPDPLLPKPKGRPPITPVEPGVR
jgi:hypothetical protein